MLTHQPTPGILTVPRRGGRPRPDEAARPGYTGPYRLRGIGSSGASPANQGGSPPDHRGLREGPAGSGRTAGETAPPEMSSLAWQSRAGDFEATRTPPPEEAKMPEPDRLLEAALSLPWDLIGRYAGVAWCVVGGLLLLRRVWDEIPNS